MINKNRNILLGFVLIFNLACQQPAKKIIFNPDTKNNTICFDADHKILSEITTTLVTKKYIRDYTECSGYLKPSPKNEAIVSSPVDGFIKVLFIRTGEYVEKDEVLAILESTGIISIQENYLITKSQYDFLKEEFSRQGELSLENATSLKIMQQSQNEFRKTEARFYSLKKLLEIIGIESDSIRVNNIRSEIEIKAPIAGKVNLLNTKPGAFCGGENILCEITGTAGKTICLNVSEFQVLKINVDQKLEFSCSINPTIIYNSKVIAIHPLRDDPKKFEVYADIQESGLDLDPEIPIAVKIFTYHDTLDVLPDEAIINFEQKTFVVLKTKPNCFKLAEIVAGKSFEKKKQILAIPDSIRKGEIVIKGSQELFKELIKEKIIR